MKFGKVEIPESLIQSLQGNKVIVFAGAGVSMGAPANLPDFVTLTRKILNLEESEKFDNPDQKLGEGFDQGVRIHEQCIRILNQGLPQPTQLHQDILRLFPKSTKVITTNFDLLFETAFKKLYPDEKVKTYNAPVFPLGNNIEGIIYLHGNINDSRSIVLSDSDFGRAYLSESWAKRLLTDAFLNYDFIFVGYSYNDTILKYLTRSLPKNRISKLYAFANIEENNNIQQINHWKSLGIEPLIYQKENGTHQQLPQAIEKLANFLNFSFSEYESFFAHQITEYEASKLEDHLNYIKFFLSYDGVYKHFYKIAQPEIWLKKIQEDVVLFDACMQNESVFFQWIVCNLEKYLNEIMDLLNHYSLLKNNQKLLWLIFRKLDDTQDKECYWKWFLFLEKELYSINNLFNGVHSWVLIKLIDFELVVGFKRAFDSYLIIQGYPQIKFLIKEYDLNRIVKKIKGKEEFHFDAIQILIEKISCYNNYLKLYKRQKLHTAWERKEIWEKDKNYSQDLEYDLVDAVIEIILENKLVQDVVNKFSQHCLYSESVLLQRFGIYLLSQFSSYNADFIYSLINLQLEWLDLEFQSEIFKFCELHYKNLSPLRKIEILTKISTSERSEYFKLKWFAWIERFAPQCELVKEKYNHLKHKYPAFVLEDKPYLAWRSSGVHYVIHSSPFSTSEIEARTDYIWYLALLDYDFHRLSFDDGCDLGYEGLWQEIVKAQPLWLIDFLEFAIQVTPEHTIISKIIDKAKNWNFDQVIHEKFYQICLKIISLNDGKQIYSISHFLNDLNGIFYYRNDLEKYSHYIELARKIIAISNYNESTILGNIDALTESLNSVNGALAGFIIRLYEQAKSNKQVGGKCESFIRLLINNDKNGFATIRLFGVYSFIKNTNSLFAQKDLLPLIFSKSEKIKLQAWRGFLENAHLEYAEFKEIQKEFFNVLNAAIVNNDKNMIKSLTDLYIYSIYFDYHDYAIESLRKLERLENNIIAEQVLDTVRKIICKEPEIDKIWSWFGEYLQDRIYQVNHVLSQEEVGKIWYLLTDHPEVIF